MIVHPQKKSILSSRVLLIIIVVVAAFLSAFLGQVAINLLTSAPSLLPQQSLVVRQPQDVYATLRSSIEEIQTREFDAFVQLYTSQIDSATAPIAQGIVLTSDGWILSLTPSENVHWQWVRLESGELLPVTATVQDPATALLFVKATATNLQPVTLADAVSFEALSPTIALGYERRFNVVTITDQRLRPNAYLSSDAVNRYYTISGGQLGQAVYNSKNEIIGLIAAGQGRDVLLGVDQIRYTMNQVLRTGSVHRASLGLQYADVASHAYSQGIAAGQTAGALLTNAIQAPNPTVISASSAAYKSGLRLGDLIVSVDGTPVNHLRGLSDFVTAAKPGQTMELGVLRAGKTLTLQVTLGEVVSK